MKRKKVVNYVKSSSRHLPEYNFGSFQMFVQDPLPDYIDVHEIFSDIKNVIPDHILESLDVIYVGDFSFLKEREINAMYSDGAIYISNVQDNNEDLKDDIVHELAHAIDEKYHDFIYADGKIEDEFLLKRNQLKRALAYSGQDISKYDFYETEYNEEFDDFLSKEIGFDALRLLAVDIFTNPYAATSLKEYFASCFEKFYLEEQVYLKELCPYVYKKLSLLNNEDYLETY